MDLEIYGMNGFYIASILTGAVTATLLILGQHTDRKKDQEAGSKDHQEVLAELKDLKSSVVGIIGDVSLEEKLRFDYPYGYILYGYQEGVTTFTPIEPKGATKISCDPGSIDLERDSASGKFILKIGKVQYLRPGANPFTLNVEQFEWKFPADDEHPYETRLLSENGQIFSLIIELLSSHDEQYIFVLAFMLRGEDETRQRIQENGVPGTSGFYWRRFNRLKIRFGEADNEEIGKVLCSLGDALCQEGRIEEGLREFRSGISMLERVKSKALNYEYGNFAWDLAHYGKQYEEAISHARRAKALYNNLSAVDESTLLGVNSTIASCLVELGRNQEAIPLLRDNLVATLMQFYRDGIYNHQLEVASKNFANVVTSEPIPMNEFEEMCRQVEREAYQRVHGNLVDFRPVLSVSQNPNI
ncbi:MAG: hypothetical protein KF905_07200 [Flavobacteriales bacterium]|nr:hypothetical protein [Flavobacteriales bacterium]